MTTEISRIPLDEPLWSSNQTAEFLGVSRKTLHNWASAGDGPAFLKVGRLRRYVPAVIREYIGTRTVNVA